MKANNRAGIATGETSLQPSRDRFEEEILDPPGMRDTALGTNDPHKAHVIARMPKPHKLDQDENVVESIISHPPLDYISAASGLTSTVMDTCQVRHRDRPRHRLQPAG